jgi:hypothetical protein
MSAELTEHLGYEPHQEPPGGAGNTRTCPQNLSPSKSPEALAAGGSDQA